MNYISTRGGMEPIGFQDAVMTGLAPDGGLLIPDGIPDASGSLSAWRDLPYPALALEVMLPFTDLDRGTLKGLIDRGVQHFRHPEIAPVVPAGPVHILELFHGPTLAFKDIALQFLGPLFTHILDRRDGELNILAATSGDTGSAAIHGVRGRERIRIFVMHPDGRVSPLQERQMTSVLDPNVYNLAVRGTFDDCQALMKSIFSDADFKARYSLGAVNSVNWARVLAQIVYYFYAAFRVMKATGADSVQFAVPTGNFGDILAGWYAMKMGLPIRRLILATNENDILHRFFTTGEYAVGETVPTLSPSMDIQIASNFERYLYYRLGEDAAAVRARMEAFRATGSLDAPPSSGAPDIVAGRGDTDETLKTIRLFADETGLILDPHTAVGVHVAQSFLEPDSPTICLATAHPAKFSDAIRRATGQEAIHPILEAIRRAPTRQDRIEADEAAIRAYLAERIAGDASA